MHEKGFPLNLTCILLIDVCFASGTKVEGILRQAADVEEVDHRVQEYEQGICFASPNVFIVCNWRVTFVEPMLLCCPHAFQTEVIPSLISLLILGKTEFGPDEDAHVVGDCIKVVVVST